MLGRNAGAEGLGGFMEKSQVMGIERGSGKCFAGSLGMDSWRNPK